MVCLGIDQAIKGGTGWCLGAGDVASPSVTMGTLFPPDGLVMPEQMHASLLGQVRDLVVKSSPNLVVIESYSMGSPANSIVRAAEFIGQVKAMLAGYGYQHGWGNAYNADQRKLVSANLRGLDQKLVAIQSKTTVNKYTLGSGSTKKETDYLLKLYKATGIEFPDDNQADAYMHVMLAMKTHSILQSGEWDESLTVAKSEAILGMFAKNKSKMTPAKAAKLSSEDKIKLMRGEL